MAPAFKLTYFNGRGVSEPIRFLFKYGNIDFEDVRVEFEDWPKIKESTPFGQLPLLEHNGKRVNQSIPIARYVAKIVKLAGNDDWENLEIDAIVDTINDLRLKASALWYEKDEERKKKILETLKNENFPFYYSRFDAIVKKNNGHFALGRLTWADLYFVALAQGFDAFVDADASSKYPNLAALRNKVNAIPAIKKWIEVRPKTEF